MAIAGAPASAQCALHSWPRWRGPVGGEAGPAVPEEAAFAGLPSCDGPVDDAQVPDAWVVDGQQRTTAFCLLFGRRPYWWEEGWEEAQQRHDVRFNAMAEDEPFFSLQTAAMRGPAGLSWVSVRELLNATDERLSTIVSGLLENLQLPGAKFGVLWTRLDRVRKIRDVTVPIVTVMLDLEDVTEVFARLNSAGTKVTEADIALALAASQNRGWVRQHFLPFLQELEEAGFELDPNLVFRSCVGIGLGRARLKEVPRAYWKSAGLLEAWKRTRRAWQEVVQYIETRGILSADILPTKTALVPLTILADRFPEVLGFEQPMAWLLHASRTGRYSGSALTALEQDLQAIQGAPSGTKRLPRRERTPKSRGCGTRRRGCCSLRAREPGTTMLANNALTNGIMNVAELGATARALVPPGKGDPGRRRGSPRGKKKAAMAVDRLYRSDGACRPGAGKQP